MRLSRIGNIVSQDNVDQNAELGDVPEGTMLLDSSYFTELADQLREWFNEIVDVPDTHDETVKEQFRYHVQRLGYGAQAMDVDVVNDFVVQKMLIVVGTCSRVQTRAAGIPTSFWLA